MKISKSFKIYIHIIITFFLCEFLIADSNFSKNIVIHEQPLPVKELKFRDSNLQVVDLTEKKGNILILNFWATWCAPCKREMPSLERLAQKFPEIEVYPINMEPPNKLRVRDFLREIGIVSLNTYYDPKLELVKKFKMRGLPTTIIIDKNGNEFARVVGEIDFFDENFIEFLKKYI